MKEWLTIAEAALLLERPKRTLYDWIKSGRLPTRVDPTGVKTVHLPVLRRVEAQIRRGRPPGTPNRQ